MAVELLHTPARARAPKTKLATAAIRWGKDLTRETRRMLAKVLGIVKVRVEVLQCAFPALPKCDRNHSACVGPYLGKVRHHLSGAGELGEALVHDRDLQRPSLRTDC